MALVRWEPLPEISSLQQEMNRLFNGFFGAPRATGGANGTARYLPALDLVETDDQYLLKVDLPGLREDDVKIELDGTVLTISGERKSDHEDRAEGWHRIERSYGQFTRSLTLPDGVRADAIVAAFDHGVLEVRIAKPEQAKPQRVNIGVGAGETIEGSES